VPNITQVADELCSIFDGAWNASVITRDIPVLYRNADRPRWNGRITPWAYFFIKHSVTVPIEPPGPEAPLVFQRYGLLLIQFFAPLADGGATLDTMGQIFIETFQDKLTPGGVALNNVRVRQIGPSGPWYYHLGVAEMTFQEIR